MKSNNDPALIEPLSRRERLNNYLGLERNVVAASGAVFLVGLGEELWKKFLPKYLESLGASIFAIGLFGTAKDFLDAVYQYPVLRRRFWADYFGLSHRRRLLLWQELSVLSKRMSLP